MKFSYSWLQSFFTEQLPEPQKLAGLLTAHSFEVEEVTKQGGDWILEIDVLPNRAHDCLSYSGLAIECAALLNSNFKIQKSLPGRGLTKGEKSSVSLSLERGEQPKNENATNVLDITIEDKNICPRYSAYVIEGVKIAESPEWIKERLAAMEQKAINNVVDITNYVMWELGQPLHAFDFDKIHGAKMNIRLSKSGETLETLDGVKHTLNDDAIVIEDSVRIIDLAGIKGGANTEIDDGANNIVFQAAIFDSAHVRRTTQKLGIKTDAAVRYIHGFDQNLPPCALERAVELLRETNPEARIVQKIDIYPSPAEPQKIILDIRYVHALLGTYLSIREIKQILEGLGFRIQRSKFQVLSSKFQVTIPSYRLDVNIEEDLIEEIGRMYGYENIAPEPPRGLLVAPRRNEKVFWRNMTRDILVSFGFTEVYNYLFLSNSQQSIINNHLLELQNPISDEFKYLRPLLLPGILKNIALSRRYSDGTQIMEVGKIFYGKEGHVQEGENLIMALSNPMGGDAENFYRLKGHVDEFLKNLGITDFYFDPIFSEEDEKWHGYFLHPTRRANVCIDNTYTGFIGEVHPNIRDRYDLRQRVFCAELDFQKIVAAAQEEQLYQKSSKYPEVVRDVALLVPRGTMVEEVLNIIETAAGPLLRDSDLFDMYEGENFPEGMKNLAFHLLFRSDERTLSSREVDSIMAEMYKAIEGMGWEARG